MLPKREFLLLHSAAAQCRELGLQIGDTIEGVEAYSITAWRIDRLKLIWIGQEIVVWENTSRTSENPEWSEPTEVADWSLAYREWKKVEVGNASA